MPFLDVDKGISRMPLRIARIYEEDVNIEKEEVGFHDT